MVLKTDYEREYYFNIDDYLISNYPTMSMNTRRAVCHLALQSIDDELLEDSIDMVVADYALTKLDMQKKEDEE